MGHPEILDQVPNSRGSKDLTGQSSDNAQHLCVTLAFHRGVLDLEEQTVLTWSIPLPWGEGRVADERYCF